MSATVVPKVSPPVANVPPDVATVAPPHRRHHRALHALLIVLAVLIGLAVVIRLLLDPIASYQTRKALGNLQGMTGDFSKVHVTVLPPGYSITHLKLTQGRSEVVASTRQPLLYVERALAGLSLHELIRGHLVASLRLEGPKITFTEPAEKAKEKAPAKAPDLSAQLAQAPALRVSSIELVGGQLLLRIPQGGEHAEVWIHDLSMTAQNLGTHRKNMGGRPATVSARGAVGRSGELKLFVSADPLAHPLSFAGEASLQGLRAAELYHFIAPHTKLQASEGTIDLFATFRSSKGALSGGVKPVLKNIQVTRAEEGLWTQAKAWLADKAVDLVSDRVAGRNAVATTVPIKGKLTDPDVQLWPAVLGVVRNAFVAGLESGFAHLPPESAGEKQSLWEQTKQALKKDEGPPKAQPAQQEKQGAPEGKR
jgi:hypothetical protein